MHALKLASAIGFLLSMSAGQTNPVIITDGLGHVLGTGANPLITNGPGGGGSGAVNLTQVNSVGVSSVTASDGFTAGQPTLPVDSVTLKFNGTNYEREYNSFSTTELASAANTTVQTGTDRITFNAKSVQLVLNVTASSGTGGLTATIQGKDSISGNYFNLNNTPTVVTANGLYVYEVGSNQGVATGGITQRTQGMIPRTVRVRVGVGDASSYTYSVSFNFGT